MIHSDDIYHEPTVEHLRNWFIVAAVIGVLIGSVLGVFIIVSEDEKFRQHQQTRARNQRAQRTQRGRRLNYCDLKKAA